MNLRERAAALRVLADDYEAVAVLEEEFDAAKQAYKNDQSPENKQAKRTLGEALALAREAVRNAPVKDLEPNGIKITPVTVG